MYNGNSQEFRGIIESASRKFNARLDIAGTIIDSGIKSIKYTGGSMGSDNISIGDTFSAYIEVTMDKQDFLIEGKKLKWQVGLQLTDSIEYIDMVITISKSR